MNAEHEEAAAVDRLIMSKIAVLLDNGGILVARKASLTERDGLILSYYVAMPLACAAVKLELLIPDK